MVFKKQACLIIKYYLKKENSRSKNIGIIPRMQFCLVQARGYNKYRFPWKLAMQYLQGSQLALLRRIRYLINNLIKSQNIISFSLPGHQGYPSSLPHTSVPTEMSESDRTKVFIGSTMSPLLVRLDCFTIVSNLMQFFDLLTYVYGLKGNGTLL